MRAMLWEITKVPSFKWTVDLLNLARMWDYLQGPMRWLFCDEATEPESTRFAAVVVRPKRKDLFQP